MHPASGTVAAAAAGNSSSHALLSQYVERHWNGSLPGVVVASRAADPGPEVCCSWDEDDGRAKDCR